MQPFIKKFNQVNLADITAVGGKNASLGEMLNQLSSKGIRLPDGFAATASCFWNFLESYNLTTALQQLMDRLDRNNYVNLKEIGKAARELILSHELPPATQAQIINAYRELSGTEDIAVAVRSSATAEDLPEASFAGQHDSFLHIEGGEAVIRAVHKCFASLYTDRAIKYREDKGFDHSKVAISVGIQKMVRSDRGSAGVCFTLEPESGFRDIIHISGVWGLGENIVQGTINPDEFLVFKPTLAQNKNAIIQKRLGDKAQTMIYATDSSSTTYNIDTPLNKREQFVLADHEIKQLAEWCLIIEEHYKKPMDIEWAKDGITGEMFIIQARPETVHSQKKLNTVTEYALQEKGEKITSGNAIGFKIASGRARIVHSPNEDSQIEKGDIIVTDTTSPDWDPILKKASAIVTNKGGRTSHASIIARELGIPAVVGCGNATEEINNDMPITVSCAEGKTGNVYRGLLKWKVEEHDFNNMYLPRHTKPLLIIGEPEKAFQLSFYPNEGVGLMRLEFIVNHYMQIHPMALVKFDELKDQAAKHKIEELTHSYKHKQQYFIDKVSQGIATIAAAFYPKDVIVRLSDFKTNEYANLIGGKEFEPKEENPMIGFRGASRYYHPLYKDAFKLECKAVLKVRNEMGFTNVKVMIPFCRTLQEGKRVIEEMERHGLSRDYSPSLEIYLMVEIPSNVILLNEFAQVFDGFSIGSNDLTQLTLGIDRDSAIVSQLFSEQDQAVKTMLSMAIHRANEAGIKIGLCGQAPSDMPDFAQFLVEQGITSISFNPDALLKGIQNIVEAENKLKSPANLSL
ncbi:phosphoenolpyruvate synthase [Flavisolibacter tropicus]|uniref:Phosphoenolpyruvate synthase n=1 Tax=Flavisolibacter tropicus TaxID=1492898 RepID=A0A172TRG4_9BACT|nr:phosphoenolpyruvate synthase [Flavisolibacter tropicus]ANE49572.1 phosphoenolpyruvate synthase [Flavisolibacter tropicus]